MKNEALARLSVTERSHACLHELFESWAERRPDAIALTFEGKELRWHELENRANRLANLLIDCAMGPGARVGILLHRSADTIVAILAVLKAGAAYVPFDSANPEERLSYMIEDSAISLLISRSILAEPLKKKLVELVCIDADATAIARQSAERPVSRVTASDLAYIIYTSGSTGKPKGVQITHRSVVHLIRATQPMFDFDQKDTWSLFHSCAFDLSVWEIFGCLASGGRLVIVPSSVGHSPSAFYDLLRREKVTVLNQTPAGIQMLLRWMEYEGHSPDSLSLRLLMCGGEALPTVLAEGLLQWKIPLWNFYGPTEATVWAACGRVEKIAHACTSVPIGPPIPSYQVELFNEKLEPVGHGEVGEIYITGPGLAVGYWNQPRLTAEKFIDLPSANGKPHRVYKTGDLGRRAADGGIEFVGRLDQQVKIRGFRVEVGEIEALLQQHPAIGRCVVIVEADRIAAFILPRPGRMVSASELLAFAEAKLPGYMLPQRFVFIEKLPLTSNGKIDRRALSRSLYWRGELAELSGSDLPERIRDIFVRIFKKPVGLKENFFELGGDSLLATCLCVEIERELGFGMRTGFLYEAPTAEKLAELIRRDCVSANLPPPVVLQEGGTRPPIFCMNVGAANLSSFHRLAHYLGKDLPSYGLVVPEFAYEARKEISVEVIASIHVAAIQNVQPTGPYFLAGVSSGGIVAFEVAQQLTAAGEEVALLAFLDASALSDDYHPVRSHIRVFRRLSWKERFAFIAKKIRRLLQKVDSTHRRVPLSPDATRFQGTMERVHRAYIPRPYYGRAVLFRARESLLCFDDGGWSQLVRGGLDIEEVPGDHTYLMENPYILPLADRMRSRIISSMAEAMPAAPIALCTALDQVPIS